MGKKRHYNQKYKDRLFRFVFQEKRDLLELYNAVNGTDYQNPEELIITTLEDAVFLGMKNDVSFIIGATMSLYEHQSTKNPNMPLRGLFYISRLYQNYVEERGYDLYGSSRIPLPFPNYLVFYNGDPYTPDEEVRLLSEAFLMPEKTQIPCVECRVKLLNINRGHNQELMKKCRKLWEYAEFIGYLKDNLKCGMKVEDAIEAAMASCLEQGILADILTRCKTEVNRMLLTEYNEKKTMAYIRREAAEMAAKEAAEEARIKYEALLAEKEKEKEAALELVTKLQQQLNELKGLENEGEG